jgi:outer membrane protein assembly factor BamD (BamD/ComL family)
MPKRTSASSSKSSQSQSNDREAVLYQAQARIKLRDYEGALKLLAANQNQAGPLADWYLLCQGEALLAKGDFAEAEADFSRLMRDFPASPHRLTGVVDAAVARMRLSPMAASRRIVGPDQRCSAACRRY